MTRNRLALVVVLAVALVVRPGDARGLPSRLTDAEFWRLVSEFSEPGGYFPAENFVSNEMEYQSVIPRLQSIVKPGGVYVGVGPDQNFTYVSALRPGMVFIVDIRRQNLLQHLMYKALFELSPTRADFLSRLFGRARPAGLGEQSSAQALFGAYDRAAPSQVLFEQNVRRVLDVLERQRRFPLTPDDAGTIRYLMRTFVEFGPDLTYAPVDTDRRLGAPVTIRRSLFPSFAELANRTDGEGVNHGYLATEPAYAFLRNLHRRNLIVPVVGDFAGPHAFSAVGDYVKSRDARVTTIYTSNVEQYLFQNGVWDAFYANVTRLPTDETSTFIRSYFPFGGRIRPNPQAFTIPPGEASDPINLYLYPESTSLLSPVADLLAAVAGGHVRTYGDVIALSR